MDTSNLTRELQKIDDVFEKVQAFLYHQNAMNANLHMSEHVRSSPLYSAVEGARDDLRLLLWELNGRGQDPV